jgi:glycosyltransferase involved in cell wall biosynthesis
MLSALCGLARDGIDWELVVVDNAGDEATRQLCAGFTGRLPLRYLLCTVPGKNAALNRGLRGAIGDLLIFTDDDILPDPFWLQEMCEGASRWPEHMVFGGRVLPAWPGAPPAFELDPAFGRWTYGTCDPRLPEGPCQAFLPLGANLALRCSVFQDGITFDEGIGPKGQDYAMGSETDLVLRLQRRGQYPVFLPRSLVRHIIRPEQLEPAWLIGRAFRHGRGETRLRGTVSWYEMARLTKHAAWGALGYLAHRARAGKTGAWPLRVAWALRRGRLHEAVRMRLGFR